MTRHDSVGTRVHTDVDVDYRLARRGIGGLWWLALLLIPLLLAGLLSVLRGDGIENDLTGRAQAALDAAGIKGKVVSFDGRDGTIQVAAEADVATARRAVEAVAGVRVADVDALGGTGTPATPPTVATPTADTPTVMAPEPTPTATADATCTSVQKDIDAAISANKIQFAEMSSQITATSQLTVQKVAQALKTCTTAKILVGGHTDNQGSPANSLPLSTQRAAAVKNALVALGIDSNRITATGFGESEPIASNSTEAGRTANRRISIKVQ